MSPITKGELEMVIKSMQKEKSLGLDGWIVELFQGFFELIGNDILRLVEESRQREIIY